MTFDHSLHDAWIESVTIGPRREIHLLLDLGSASISDPRLPDAATFRLGAIANFDEILGFFARFAPAPIARIDCVTVLRRMGPSSVVALEIDPQGIIEVTCSKLDLLPAAPA